MSGRVPLDYWVTRPYLRLCGVVILVDQARDDGFSPDTVWVDGSGCALERLGLGVRGPLVSGLMRPVPVVVDQVLAEDQGQVAFAEDQEPVQEFTAEGADDAFADGVHPRSLRQGGDDPQLFRLEHLTEGSGEERITIMNKKTQRFDALAQVHGQSAFARRS